MYLAAFSFTVKPWVSAHLFHQQGDGHAHVNHHEAFSCLAPGLVTPRDLPGSNTDVRYVADVFVAFGLRLAQATAWPP